ncbi:MAG: thiamine pyrophosphate-binding protein [Thermodesulfobacteriota bacterium]
MKTAELVVAMLEDIGVEYVFGVPGGAIEDLNCALYKRRNIKPIVTKHEEGAAFMADGYARLSGRLGVCCATAGPGASNLITGIASAYADSIPVLTLTGQVATSVFGKGAIQETGSEGVTTSSIYRHFTRYSGLMMNEKRAEYMVQKAIRTALSERNRPVHLSLPADIMKRRVRKDSRCTIPEPGRFFDRDGVRKAAARLLAAKRPVIIAGWGVVRSRGAEELRKLAERLDIPVATSPKAKGVFPESHPLSLGVLGFAGSPVAKEYIVESEVDVMLAVGTSFNEMMTSGWDRRLEPSQCLIQIDIDFEEIGKNFDVCIRLLGDARTVLLELDYEAQRQAEAAGTKPAAGSSRGPEVAVLRLKHRDANRSPEPRNGRYHPQDLVEDIQKSFPADTIFFADCGNSMAWAIRHLVMERPYSFYVSLGFASMGYAVAAPVGAKLAFPDRPIVALVGDGSFLMNGFEVATAVNYRVPVIWVVLNNAMLGMVYHGRRLFKKPIPEGIPSQFQQVDFARVAEGLGARGIRVDWAGGITPDLVANILESGQPTVLDVHIDPEAVPPIHSRIQTVDRHFR